MKLKTQVLITVFIVAAAAISSCVNLGYVHEYSSSSLDILKKYEDIDYSFNQSCIDRCVEEMVTNFELETASCDCAQEEKADSITNLIYNAVYGYFDGLAKISNDELTDYNFDDLKKSITGGTFGSIQIQQETVNSYARITSILTKAFTDEFRKKKIKEYVKEANEPISILIKYLDLNMSSNLKGKLIIRKQLLKSAYFDLTNDTTISNLDKRELIQEYHTRIGEIEALQKELEVYSVGLQKIMQSHKALSEGLDEIDSEELKQQLSKYATDFKAIASEIDKLNK